jgi:hypothetical protein
MIVSAEEVVRDITLLIFICCNSAVVIKIGLSWEGMDVMVKLLGCRPGLWVVLLQVSWAWNMSNIPSKNALILRKKNPSVIPSFKAEIPLHFAQIPPQQMGYLRCDSRGIYITGTYPGSRNL